MSKWTLFSNHGHVLLFLSRDPEVRLRDVAASVGITERAVQKIVRDLQDGGMITVTKHGRRNRYQIRMEENLRHQLESHRTVGDLVNLIDMPITQEPALEVVGLPGPTEPASSSAEPREPKPEARPPELPPDPVAESKPVLGGNEAAEDSGEQGSLF